MRLSVVVISWNSLPMLQRCLESLRAALVHVTGGTEIVWVDNGSTDGSADYVANNYPEVKRIILDRNYGVAAARNRGVAASSGRYVLFVDDDTEPTAEAVEAMLAHMDAHSSTGVCAVALHDADGNIQPSFKPYPGLGQKIRNVVLSRLGRDNRAASLPEHIIHPCYVIGACQMIRKMLFDTVGMLDDHIFYGPEDADFCIRVRRAGYTIDYLPHASMLHHWRRMTRRNLLTPNSRRHIKALLYFYRKHHRIF